MAASCGVSGPHESPLWPPRGLSPSPRCATGSHSQGIGSSPQPIWGPWCPQVRGLGGRTSTHTLARAGHICTHATQASAARSEPPRDTSRPPAPPAGSNLLGTGRWSSLAAPERPSPAAHPHSDGSARTAASGPLPCWNEPSALEFVEKSGVFRLLFFLARPYRKLVGKPEG